MNVFNNYVCSGAVVVAQYAWCMANGDTVVWWLDVMYGSCGGSYISVHIHIYTDTHTPIATHALQLLLQATS